MYFSSSLEESAAANDFDLICVLKDSVCFRKHPLPLIELTFNYQQLRHALRSGAIELSGLIQSIIQHLAAIQDCDGVISCHRSLSKHYFAFQNHILDLEGDQTCILVTKTKKECNFLERLLILVQFIKRVSHDELHLNL